MRITVDTNVLLRIIRKDDPEQARVAADALAEADVIVVSIQTLCEVVWVLQSNYKIARKDIAMAIGALVATHRVVVDRLAVEAGLRALGAGGDFADGVIAFDGARNGGDVFVSFDRRAIKALESEGHSCRLLS